jgi:hypothetical protein
MSKPGRTENDHYVRLHDALDTPEAQRRRQAQAEFRRRQKAREAVIARIGKLREMRADRGAAPAEAVLAKRKALELEAKLGHGAQKPAWGNRRPKPINLRARVTARALYQRINRVLPDGVALKISRKAAGFCLVENDVTVVDNVDIEALGRELRVLKPHEALAGPEGRKRRKPARRTHDPSLVRWIPAGNDHLPRRRSDETK